MAKIINGKEISEKLREQMTAEVKELAAKGIVPGLAVILVGQDPASQVYVSWTDCMNWHWEIKRKPANRSAFILNLMSCPPKPLSKSCLH